MQSWQVIYHLIFFLLSILVFSLVRTYRGREFGNWLIWIPLAMATIAEIGLQTFWPPDLGTSSTAGVGIVIAWLFNFGLGVTAGFVCLVVPGAR